MSGDSRTGSGGISVRLYVVTHANAAVQELEGFSIIHAGRTPALPPGHLDDVPAVGERLENRRWSELSAIYKVWKDGLRADVVGFCHYRRYLSFVEPKGAAFQEVTPGELRAVGEGLLPTAYLAGLAEGSVIVAGGPYHFNVPIPQQYARHHIAGDYEVMAEVTREVWPALCPFVEGQAARYTLRPHNMFVCSWADFDELCRGWFTVLPEVARRLEWPRGEGAHQDRDVGFMAERLFDAWLVSKEGTAQIVERPILSVESNLRR